jgi:hypothetical protein
MKKLMVTIMIISTLTLMLVGSACNEGGGEGTIRADSSLHKAMKMVPSEWNVFSFLNAKEMRTDVEVPVGMNAIWDKAEDYMDSFIEAAELDPANWPLPVDSIDYLAIAGGGSSEVQTYRGPSIVFIIKGSFSLAAVSNYLDNFDTNYPDADISFRQGTYNGVETWAPDTEQYYDWQEDPDVLIALTTGSSVVLVGNTEGVKDCINVIKGTGDEDSMLGNDGVIELAANFSDAVFAGIVYGDQEIPSAEYSGAPDYPERFVGMLGFGVSRVEDRLRLELVAEMNDWGEWQEFLVNELPDSGRLPYPFGGGYYDDPYRGVEEARRTEKRSVEAAIIALMVENGITSIPNPRNYASGFATNSMGMFPDYTSVAGSADKLTDAYGNTFTVTTDKNGWVLYGHDKDGDGSQTGLVNYVNMTHTMYYYTCESDGTIRQWSDSNMTMEYTN